uniref:Eukaryotic translation initiation factor 3 subunit G n=1 Tax=Molossus molossus TaxID=27622 RepID=A0A7J8I5D0_MOLMO|nr:eukaryotic translation initiation factor 3 subunit G [Molossus molossus]
MPTGDFDSKPSWADQVEEEVEDDKCVTSELLKGIPLSTGDTSPEPELLPGAPLPSPKEVINGNIKTVTEYKIDEDGKKFKIVRTFRIETRKASKAVARRKNWKKFGNSEFDPPGPNVATTTVSDDVSMTFITSKEDLNCQEEEDPMNKLKGQKIVSCRICKGDNWACPLARRRNFLESWNLCRRPRTRRGNMCPQACGTGPAAVGSPCSPTVELMTMPPSVSPTCQRTPVRQTCKSSSGPLAPFPASTWRRTRPLASPRDLPSSASTVERMLPAPLPECLASAMTTSFSTLSGLSHPPTKPVVAAADAAAAVWHLALGPLWK